jgi:hypothetical protein
MQQAIPHVVTLAPEELVDTTIHLAAMQLDTTVATLILNRNWDTAVDHRNHVLPDGRTGRWTSYELSLVFPGSSSACYSRHRLDKLPSLKTHRRAQSNNGWAKSVTLMQRSAARLL